MNVTADRFKALVRCVCDMTSWKQHKQAVEYEIDLESEEDEPWTGNCEVHMVFTRDEAPLFVVGTFYRVVLAREETPGSRRLEGQETYTAYRGNGDCYHRLQLKGEEFSAEVEWPHAANEQAGPDLLGVWWLSLEDA